MPQYSFLDIFLVCIFHISKFFLNFFCHDIYLYIHLEVVHDSFWLYFIPKYKTIIFFWWPMMLQHWIFFHEFFFSKFSFPVFKWWEGDHVMMWEVGFLLAEKLEKNNIRLFFTIYTLFVHIVLEGKR